MNTSKIELLKRHPSGCPYLFLAPMEGVGDRPFRRAMASVGGFDEAVTEFIRVPHKAHVESLAKVYEAQEIAPIPIAAQIMGSDPELMAEMGKELVKRGAHRIDLNCGCPSNTVTGKGAGSSLLKNPDQLYTLARALVEAVSVPVTLKMRSGYDDTDLFIDNLKAAEATGVKFITVHPRTKKEGYSSKANWDLIAQAKATVSIPVVGNGDILNIENALSMLAKTSCDALMIGRGAVTDPFVFRKIKAHFLGEVYQPTASDYCLFLKTFYDSLSKGTPAKNKISKVKQILGFMFKASESLILLRPQMLTLQTKEPDIFLEQSLALLVQGIETKALS